MGRHLKASKDDVIAALAQARTEAKAAAILGVTPRSVRNYIKRWSLKHDRQPPRHYGCLATWLFSHPKEVLPRSVARISQLTGCTRNEVASYLCRRFKKERLSLRSKLPDLRRKTAILYDLLTDTKYRSGWLESYQLWLDPRNYNMLFLKGKLKNNKRVKSILDRRKLK